MLFQIEDSGDFAALPTDITLRTPIYRRQGIIATAIVSVVSFAFGPTRPRGDKRQGGKPPPLSNHLRRDIGLEPESRSPVWDDIRWK